MEQQRWGDGGCVSKSLQFDSLTVNNACRPPWRASFGVSVTLEDFKPLLRDGDGEEGKEGAVW